MTADAMLAVIRETYPRPWVFCGTIEWTVSTSIIGPELGRGRTRWQAIFAAYKAVRRSQGKAVIEA